MGVSDRPRQAQPGGNKSPQKEESTRRVPRPTLSGGRRFHSAQGSGSSLALAVSVLRFLPNEPSLAAEQPSAAPGCGHTQGILSWNWLLGFDHSRVAPIIENRFQTAGSRGCYSFRHTDGISTSQRAFPTARRTLPSFRRQRRNKLNPPEILTKQQQSGRHHHKSLGSNISQDVGPRPALTQLCSQAP